MPVGESRERRFLDPGLMALLACQRPYDAYESIGHNDRAVKKDCPAVSLRIEDTRRRFKTTDYTDT